MRDWLLAEHVPGETNLDLLLYRLREILSRYDTFPNPLLLIYGDIEVELRFRA